MAIKFAGICGKDVQIVGTNRRTVIKQRPHTEAATDVCPTTTIYPRISAMRIVTAVTRPTMSASPG
jgi:hypothetical protein